MTNQEFKETSIGCVPVDWEVIQLGQVAKISSGGSAPQGDQYFGGQLPFIRVSHLSEGSLAINQWDNITDEAVKKYKLKIFPRGTIVFPKSGASIRLEKRAVIPVDAYIVSHLCTVNANTNLADQSYLLYALKYHKFSEGKADGYPTLSLSEIIDTYIPIPPLPEQRAIAHVLTAVRQSIEATEGVISSTCKLKRSLTKYLFTYGLIPIDMADQSPLKETEIGEVPMEWEITKLQEILSEPLRNGHSAQLSSSDDGIRTLTLTAVTKRDFSIENTKITNASPIKVRDMWLRPGDIFIERANTPEYVGLVALYEGDEGFAIFPDLMIRIRVDKNRANTKFIEEFLLSPICRRYYMMRAKKTAGSFPKIDQPIVENTPIVLPGLNQQYAISNVIYQIESKIKVEGRRKIALEVLFNSLLHHLMTGKIRVKY